MSMRLLLVTDAVGGVWVYSLELARALEPLGVETVLAVMGPSSSAAQREEASRFKLIDTGLPLDWLDTSADALACAGDAIANIAAKEAADVVQTCSAALLAEAAFDQPCVAVQHSCVASWWAAVKGTPLPREFEWRRELVGRGLERAAAVVAPTHAFAVEIARIYGVDDPLCVHNGCRASRLSSLGQADFVLTAGRLWDEGKNIATLDKAAARLNVPFEAAGPVCGPNGSVATIGNMRTLGELSRRRLAALLGARPIFASAALYEPFGLAALEAAQAGCALVLSDIPTHRELWGGAAIFVPARDHHAYASAIQSLLDDREERESRGRRARRRAQHYAPERMASRTAEIYAGLAQPARRQMAGAA